MYLLQMLWKLRIFPGSFTLTSGLFYFGFSGHPQDMYLTFAYAQHIFLGHSPAKLFVYIQDILQRFCIFPKSFTWTPELFLSAFPHIPGTCTAFLPACDICKTMSLLPPDLKNDALENLAFSLAIYTTPGSHHCSWALGPTITFRLMPATSTLLDHWAHHLPFNVIGPTHDVITCTGIGLI